MLIPDRIPPTFFSTFQEAFERAVQARGVITREYLLVGNRLRLQFAGPALLPDLTRAFDHLSIAAEPLAVSDLSVAIWDSASSGVPLPVSQFGAIGLRGELSLFSDERYLAAMEYDAGALSVLDQVSGQAIYWMNSAAGMRVYERAAPLKIILHWWLRRRGWPMVHAGAIGNTDCAVLLVGKSGAGKSTTTLACLEAGLDFISDDRCLVKIDPQPEAYCVYNTAKLHSEQMRRFARLWPSVSNPQNSAEKALVFLSQHASAQLARQRPLRAAVLGRISGRPATTLETVSPAHLLRELATSTMLYQPGMAGDEFHSMAVLLKKLPCYQINLGTQLEGIPPVLAQLLG